MAMIIRTLPILLLLVLTLTVVEAQEVSWGANGRDAQGTRYLPASDITREAGARLEVAWSYRASETGPRVAPRARAHGARSPGPAAAAKPAGNSPRVSRRRSNRRRWSSTARCSSARRSAG